MLGEVPVSPDTFPLTLGCLLLCHTHGGGEEWVAAPMEMGRQCINLKRVYTPLPDPECEQLRGQFWPGHCPRLTLGFPTVRWFLRLAATVKARVSSPRGPCSPLVPSIVLAGFFSPSHCEVFYPYSLLPYPQFRNISLGTRAWGRQSLWESGWGSLSRSMPLFLSTIHAHAQTASPGSTRPLRLGSLWHLHPDTPQPSPPLPHSRLVSLWGRPSQECPPHTPKPEV